MKLKSIVLLGIAAFAIIFMLMSFSGRTDYSIPLSVLNFVNNSAQPVFNHGNESTVLNPGTYSTVPLEELVVHLTTQAPLSASGTLLFYECNISNEGVLICDVPNNADPILTLPVSHSIATYNFEEHIDVNGTSARFPLYLDVPYAIYFAGGKRFYDSYLGADVFTQSRMGEPSAEVIYTIAAVGEIADPLFEDQPINGQPSTDSSRYTSVEIGCDGGCENDDILVYDKESGDGEIYFDISIGCDGYGMECRNLLLAFDYDFPKPEGNEIESIHATLVSGPDLHMPTDLKTFFRDRLNVPIGTLQSGVKSTYRVSIRYNERNLDQNDPFCIVIDDLGTAGDIFGDAKGSPKRICFSAQ